MQIVAIIQPEIQYKKFCLFHSPSTDTADNCFFFSFSLSHSLFVFHCSKIKLKCYFAPETDGGAHMPRIVSSARTRLNLGRVQNAHSTTDAWSAALDVCRKIQRRAYNPLLCFKL